VVVAALIAAPPVSVTAPPRFTPSTLNWTVPSTVPAPGATAVTVAEKLMLSPKTAELSDDVSATLVFALFTTWTVLPFLARKLVSPA